ncbi:MAG: carbamoyltransferase N-terminal domain-containing protein [Deltaproteobacteria bacterium]|jgi:carbamoyltransferase
MFRIWQSTHRMVIRHDPQLGHRYVENLEARIPNELGGSFVKTNAQGFRNDIDFEKKKGDRPRILFFGDSYTAGDLCSNHERFSDLVGAKLDAETYNFGLSGSGTDQQYLSWKNYAKDIEADLIVISVLSENIERIKVSSRISIDRVTGDKVMMPKPFFTLKGSQLELGNVPCPWERPPVDTEEDDRFGSHRRDPRLKLAYKAVDFYRNDPRAKKARELFGPVVGRLRPAVMKASGFQPFPDYKSADTEGWRLMEAILRQWAAEASPTPVLIVPLPTYHNIKDEVEPIYQPLFERVAAPKNKVHVADITAPIMKMSREDRVRIPFEEDVHFSPYGHEVVATQIAEAITSRSLLPKPAAPKPAKRRRAEGTYILGVSAFYHNSAASIVKDGEIIAAAEEERFTREKNDRRFPHSAINFCLEQAKIDQRDLSAVVYYDNAPLTFERLLHTQAVAGEKGADNWGRFIPSWTLYKLHIPRLIRDYLHYDGLILQEAHHRSHAASAFYPSPFEEAAILTIDGVGEWATASIGVGRGNRVDILKEMHFPNSVGLLYSAFTQFTGFKVNSGEYKMMGLAPYGEAKYVDLILDNLVKLKDDGSIELDLSYFSFLDENTMTNAKFAELFGGPARDPDAWITEREMDIAKSIQVVTEMVMMKMAQHAQELTGMKNLCMAGGVALNCVSNGKLLREGPFDDIFIQPAAGDSGGSLGAALDAYHSYFGKERKVRPDGRSSQGASYLGPSFSDDEIQGFLESNGYPFERVSPEERASKVADVLASGRVVGHLADRLEFGPRALGARSILGDARNQEMQVNLNLKIKYRESFRPFAPSVLEEDVSEFFEMEGRSPYMLLVAPVKASRRLDVAERKEGEDLTEVVKRPRSDVPAITHVDYSARVQTVNGDEHPTYYRLIKAFKEKTGYGVVVNTSFNVRGEPIVCTPYDAYRCFMRTEMDVLVLENFILYKDKQPSWPEAKGHVEFDVEAKQNFDPGFVDKLQAVFFERFLPTAARIATSGDVRISKALTNAPSTWRDLNEPDDKRPIFEIPSELAAASTAGPGDMARAITSNWNPRFAAASLMSIVSEVLALGEEYRTSGELEEEVGDSVYVMF